MSCHAGPDIVENGLVFCYDMNNTQKSWKGKPTINLQLPNIIDWSTNAIITPLSELSPIGTSVYSVTDNNSGSYLESTRNITVPNDSNTYTISIYIKKTYGATSTRLGFNSGFSGGTTVAYNQRFNSDTGVGNYGSTVDLGNWWRWQFQITNNNTGNTTLYCSFYPATGFYDSGDNFSATGTATVSAIQIEQNPFATPFVHGTRSNTQAILDLTSNNIITANSPTYNVDGTFSFSAINQRITTPISSTNFINSNFTWEVWVKGTEITGGVQNMPHIGYGSGGWSRLGFQCESGYWKFRQYNSSGPPITSEVICGPSSTSDWKQIVVVGNYTNLTIQGYYNGIFNASQAYVNSSGNGSVLGIGMSAGTYEPWNQGFNGYISTMKIYNRALSAAEVAQNFNATRKLYGI